MSELDVCVCGVVNVCILLFSFVSVDVVCVVVQVENDFFKLDLGVEPDWHLLISDKSNLDPANFPKKNIRTFVRAGNGILKLWKKNFWH